MFNDAFFWMTFLSGLVFTGFGYSSMFAHHPDTYANLMNLTIITPLEEGVASIFPIDVNWYMVDSCFEILNAITRVIYAIFGLSLTTAYMNP